MLILRNDINCIYMVNTPAFLKKQFVNNGIQSFPYVSSKSDILLVLPIHTSVLGNHSRRQLVLLYSFFQLLQGIVHFNHSSSDFNLQSLTYSKDISKQCYTNYQIYYMYHEIWNCYIFFYLIQLLTLMIKIQYVMIT